MELEVIAKMHSPMVEKFGLPRQSGLAKDLKGTIVFEKEYADPEAVKGLEGYDYIWILWEFEGVKREEKSLPDEAGLSDPTPSHFRAKVRPPRLGGNEYMGVFATRSPFRPNPIGMSCVKLEKVEITADGPVLHVLGADLRDGTPIFDIKPYLPYTEAHPDARGGFTDTTKGYELEVDFPEELKDRFIGMIRAEKSEDDASAEISAVTEILSQDPRPAYHDDPERVYGMRYDRFNIKFRVDGGKAIVEEIEDTKETK